MPDTPENNEKTEKKDDKPAEVLDAKVADEASAAPAAPEDDASPEAIARRVAALGDDDEIETIARAEELKLAERRAKMRKGKKGGLEAAASKRLNKIAEKAQPKRLVATAVDGADPLLKQTAKFSTWAKKNQTAVGSVAIAGLLAVAGVGGYNYFQQKKEGDASAELARAVADERGRIGDPDKEEDTTGGPKDTRPVFKTEGERRESALKKFRDVESRFPGTGAAILSRLSEGSLLLDGKQPDPAIAAFNDVKASALGQIDAEVRGRALEGLGFAYEQKGNLDEAAKTFKELENNVDVLGFKELGMYHQARVLEAKGDKDKAKELLKTVHERINKPGENYPFPYLKEVADDRLRALDPSAVPPKQQAQMGGPGGNKMNEEQLKKLIEQLKKQQGAGGGGGGGAP